jgi:hypothetical protein
VRKTSASEGDVGVVPMSVPVDGVVLEAASVSFAEASTNPLASSSSSLALIGVASLVGSPSRLR